jgi:hypothetical protein
MALKAILKSNDRLAIIYKTRLFHEAGDNFFPKNSITFSLKDFTHFCP